MDSECVNCDDLARENDELRARLAQVEAERDEALADDFVIRAEAAEARLAEVEAELADRNDAALEEGRSTFWRLRATAAAARLAAVRRALDDEIANLADDGARLSHAVVRRIEAALDPAAAAGDDLATPTEGTT